MELISVQFAAIIALALAAYYALGRFAPKYQWIFLLACSLGIYCLMGVPSTVLLMLVTTVDVWAAGLALDRIEQAGKRARKQAGSRDERKALKAKTVRDKRLALAAALLVPVGILAYFKYANVVLFNFGLEPSPTSLGILLPLGISFYTFQALGYLIDAYNAKYPPERSLPRLLLFVTWFPQLIEGPIGRYDQLAGQLVAERHADAHAMRKGLLTIGYGVFKKVVIANVLASNVSSIISNASPAMPGSIVLYGLISYSVQMYADFSGGIDMVRGVSELFGIELAVNFNQPYLSTSLADFWRRWHMSLGSWMRDYIFYPFALIGPMQAFGKWTRAHLSTHVGRILPACVANVVVFLFVGLWHGAEWHYLAWGLYNGLVVALSDLFAPAFRHLSELLRIDTGSRGYKAFAIVRTFAVVNIGRIFDIVPDLSNCFDCLYNLVFRFDAGLFRQGFAAYGLLGDGPLGIPLIVAAGCVVVAIVSWQKEHGMDVRERFLALPAPVRLLVIGALAILVFSKFGITVNMGGGFLYANF